VSTDFWLKGERRNMVGYQKSERTEHSKSEKKEEIAGLKRSYGGGEIEWRKHVGFGA